MIEQKQPPDSDNTELPPQRSGKDFLRLWFVFIIIYMGFIYFQEQQSQNISYSQFKQQVEAGQIVEILIQDDKITGDFSYDTNKKFTTFIPTVDDPSLMSLLENKQVVINSKSGQVSWLVQLVVGIIPWMFIVVIFWLVSSQLRQRMGGGVFGFSQSKAKRFEKTATHITFEDIAGLENAKQDLLEITDYLKRPERYHAMGAKMPRGILLMGPPGTGKTLLAKAVAGEANIPFFSISGSEFIELFVGVGASRVRDLFDSAKQEAPSIIFIDEIDSVGRSRGTGLGGGHDEREQTLNQILNEMDGFEDHEPVVVLAATNRPDVLDAALLRPGRFDRKIVLDLPDMAARIAILKIHSKAVPLADDVDLAHISSITVGFSGADLENLINEAALLSVRKGESKVTMSILLDSRDKVVLGGQREIAIDEDEKKIVACHESGHALVAALLPDADTLTKVTIIPRGGSLGFTELIPLEKYNLSESYLRSTIAVMLAGRVSEKIILGQTSTGCENDLIQATSMARHMISNWGMSETLGPVAFIQSEEHVFLGKEIAQRKEYSEYSAQIIDQEISQLLTNIEKETHTLLEKNTAKLKLLIDELMKKETLNAQEIFSIIDQDNTLLNKQSQQ